MIELEKDEHKNDFEVLHKNIFRDRNMPSEAKVILSFILSCDTDWVLTQKGLVEVLNIPKYSVEKAWKYLTKNGFIIEIGRVYDDRGKFSHYNYKIVERPKGYVFDVYKSKKQNEDNLPFTSGIDI